MEQEKKNCPYCGEEVLAIAKKCKHCGEWLNNEEEQREEKNMVPCPICGEIIENGTTKCPYCNESLNSKDGQEAENEEKPITTGTIKTRGILDYYFVEPFIKHYFRFKGRINKKHFWMSMLLWFTISALIITIFIFNLSHGASETVGNTMVVIMAVWFFGSTIPLGAIVLRRMRDGDSEIGLWGWWFYILPLPYMIFIVESKQPIWLCIIPFAILLWWLIKPSDDNMRDDGLLPDEQPKLKINMYDRTAIGILFIVFLGGLLPGILSNKTIESSDDNEITIVEDDKKSEVIEIPYNVLSVDEAITVYAFYPSGSSQNVLVQHGYQYGFDNKNEYYTFAFWTKDCKLVRSTDGYLPSSWTESSSYVEINSNNGLNVYAFNEDVFKAWYKQLVALGYEIEHNEGNQGQDWTAQKDGEPDISLWNDYGENYCLTIGNPYQ